jgi:hypothetical protein
MKELNLLYLLEIKYNPPINRNNPPPTPGDLSRRNREERSSLLISISDKINS